MRIKIFLSLIIAVFAVTPVYADNGQYYFKFDTISHKQVNQLSAMISIAKIDSQTVYAFANDSEFTAFRKLGIPYEILPDPGSLTLPAMAPNLDRLITDWDVYPTYQQYLDMMNAFAADYPDLCTIVNIGTTVQGRQLLVARISDNVNIEEDEPEVEYSATIHGNETAGYVLMLRLIDYLLTNYGVDPRVTYLVNNLEIWINPLENPDGTYRGGNDSISHAVRYNANSADLNRNFPDPVEGQHRGGENCEPETIAMLNFFAGHTFTLSTCFHGGADVVVYPWNTMNRSHCDESWYLDIARAYADSAHVYSNYNGYMTYLDNGITNGYDWYRVVGGRLDCMTYFMGGRETTIELSGYYVPPAEDLPTYWDYNKVSFLDYLENALYGIRGIVTYATDGAPCAAIVNVLNHDADSAHVFTDPQVGDYHRMIAPGTYDLQFVAPGCVSQTIRGITASYHAITRLDVQMQRNTNNSDLNFSSHDGGYLGIGDTIAMHITLENNGWSDAPVCIGSLSTADSNIIILQDSSSYPVIQALGNGISLSQYRLAILPSCPLCHSAQFDLTLSGVDFTDTCSFSLVAGRLVEDFESGNFNTVHWQLSGNSNWYVTNDSSFNGSFCARSGAIHQGQSSDISIRLNIINADEIRFRYKVSTELWDDHLSFYIDDVLQYSRSGEIDWSEAVIPVSEGVHTFKWSYLMAFGGSHYRNCCFLDNITFPQLASLLDVVTTSLSATTVDYPYSRQLRSSGGIGTTTWDDRYDDLSGTGLTLSPNGLVSGTPLIDGMISFTAEVRDTMLASQKLLTIMVNPHLAITTPPVIELIAGMPSRFQMTCSGGTGIKTWSDLNHNLVGTYLAMTDNGIIYGTPPRPTEIYFTAQVYDIIGDTISSLFHISVVSPGIYLPGDANSDRETNGIDVVYLSNFFMGGSIPPLIMECPPHGDLFPTCDINGNCVVNGIDVTYLVRYFKGGPDLRFCTDCPPAAIQMKTNPQNGVADNK